MKFNWKKRNRFSSVATYNGLRIEVYITGGGFWYYSYYALDNEGNKGHSILNDVNNMKQAKLETEKRINENTGKPLRLTGNLVNIPIETEETIKDF